jgi:hypothetical protein
MIALPKIRLWDEVKTGSLTPLNIEDADAVFMEPHHFHCFDWPDDLVKIVNIAPKDVDEHTRREADKVIPLRLTGENKKGSKRGRSGN